MEIKLHSSPGSLRLLRCLDQIEFYSRKMFRLKKLHYSGVGKYSNYSNMTTIIRRYPNEDLIIG